MKGPVFGVFTVVCAVLVNVVSTASLSRDELDNSSKCRGRYGYKFYYDHGTEHCEQCREICQNAQIMGTEQQCNEECPLYKEAVKCQEREDKYYDDMVDKCSPCSDLCQNHQVTGTTRECREKCSGYLEKLTPKQVPSLHKQNHLKAMDGSEVEEQSQTSDLLVHPGWIAAMAVGGVALVCVIVVVVVFYWTCNQQQKQQYGPAPQTDREQVTVEDAGEECRRNRSRRPVEETSQGTSGSQHFAIDGASTALPTMATVAFPELPVGRNPSAAV